MRKAAAVVVGAVALLTLASVAHAQVTLNSVRIGAMDTVALAKFYQAAFGYEVDEMDMGGEQPFRLLKVNGRGIAGVREPTSAGQPPHWSTVFAVADADETAGKAKELGGTVLMEPFDLPEIGRLAVLQDPAGAVFQVMQPFGDPPPPPS